MVEKCLKIKLPSEFIFRLKPISAIDLIESTKDDNLDLSTLINRCSVDPKLTLDTNDRNSLSLDELDSDDILALIENLLEESGLTDDISKQIKTSDFGKMIAFTAYTFKLRPSDLLDPEKKLPELTNLFFDFYCSNLVNEALSGEKNKGNVQRIDEERKENLKKTQRRRKL